MNTIKKEKTHVFYIKKQKDLHGFKNYMKNKNILQENPLSLLH